jgi:hypothetical protein
MTLAVFLLGGCSSLTDVSYRNGPDVDFPATQITSNLQRQDEAATLFINYALGENAVPRNNADWHAAANTGFNYVHGVCDDYLNFIERLQRDKDTTDKGLGAASIATTSILAAANAANSLKYVAASLGLATSLNDAIFERYLFGQDVSVVKEKVDELMGAYESTVSAQTISSRADLILVVRNDLQYCTPAVIEANITSAIQGTSATVQTPGGAPVKTPGTPAPSGAIPAAAAGLNAKATLSPN